MRKIKLSSSILCIVLGWGTPALAIKAGLSVKASNYTGYFTSVGKLRHHRYESTLKQNVRLSSKVSSYIEGRVRLDLTMAPTPLAPYSTVVDAVRNDEFTEAEFREFYLNDLGDTYRLRVGAQKIDWVEVLSPYASDALTPIDFRYGGFGDFGEIIVPVLSVNFNHKFLGGTLDWLFVPLPRTDRFPAGDNGYGFYPYLESLAPSLQLTISENTIPKDLKESELGVRYLLHPGDVDLTFLFYHGHQRNPRLTLTEVSASAGNLVQDYPQVNTAGFFGSYSQGAWVSRLMFLFQPSKGSAITVAPDTSSDRFMRAGIGFDYVFSRDLKIYSELLATQLQTTLVHGGVTSVSSGIDYMATVRATNESLKDLLFSLTAIYTFPHTSYFLSPEMVWTLADDCKLIAGAYLVRSDSTKAALELLKNSSQVYGRFEYFFDIK